MQEDQDNPDETPYRPQSAQQQQNELLEETYFAKLLQEKQMELRKESLERQAKLISQSKNKKS